MAAQNPFDEPQNPFNQLVQVPAPPEPEQSLLVRGFRGLGEVVVETGKDILDLPGRTLRTLSTFAQPEVVALTAGAIVPGARQALQSQPELLESIRPEEISPEEARDRILDSLVDVVLLGIPAGRLGAGVRGLKGTALRSTLDLAKFSALTPPREDTSLRSRLETGVHGAIFGGAFPVVGRVLSPLGRAGQGLFARGVEVGKNILARLSKPGGEKAVTSTANKLQRMFFDSFFGRTPSQVIQEDLPAIFRPLIQETRDLLSEAGRIVDANIVQLAERGTIPAREEAGRVLGQIAKKLFPETGTVLISEQRLRGTKAALVVAEQALSGASERIRVARLRGEVPLGLQQHFDGFVRFFEALTEQFLKQRRAAGRSLRTFQDSFNLEVAEALAAHLERIGIAAGNLPQRFSPATRGLISQYRDILRSGRPGALLSAIVRGPLRAAVFPITSPIADTLTNSLRLGQRLGQSLLADVFSRARGEAGVATEGMIRGIFHSAHTKLPSVLQPTAMGIAMEKFTNRFLDTLLFTGAVGKRFVDSQFAKVGFFSTLYEEGLRRAEKAGLVGVERTSFVRRFVLNAEKEAPETVSRAVAVANDLRFFGPLSKFEETFANNPITILFLNPFMRFTFQFFRWMAEFTPFSPSFLKKLAANKATGADLTGFLARNATGVGGLYFVDQTIYDDIDFDTMEYVDPNTKERFSMNGLDPLPFAVGVVAMIRGETTNMMKAFRRGAGNVLTPEGFLSDIFDQFENLERGARPETVLEKIKQTAANFIPGKALLGAVSAVFGEPPRSGFGRTVPGAGEPIIDPLTGEVRRSQRVFGLPGAVTDIPAPRVFGSRLTARRLNELEQLFEDLEIDIRFPSPVGLINPETGEKLDKVADVSMELQRRFQIQVGKERRNILAQINFESFRKQPKEVQKQALRQLMGLATRVAKARLNHRLQLEAAQSR